MKVKVYKNLHKTKKDGTPVYSVWSYDTRRVWDHRSVIVLENCEFKVRESGKKKVRRERRKNVHAFIIGELSTEPFTDILVDPMRYINTDTKLVSGITYDPYHNDSFVLRDSLEPIYFAKRVYINGRQITARIQCETV